MVSYQSKHAITCIDQTWLLIVFLAFCTKAFWVNSQLCTLRDNFLTRRFFCSFFSGLLLHFWDSLSIVLQWKLSSPFCLHFSYSKCFLWNCQVAREGSFLFPFIWGCIRYFRKLWKNIPILEKKNAPNFCCNRDFFCDSIVLNYTVIRKPVRDDYDDLYLEHKKRLFMTPTHIIKAKLWLPEKKGKRREKKKKSFLTNWFLFQVETFVCSRPCRDLRTYAPKTNGPWANAVHAHHTTTTPKKL